MTPEQPEGGERVAEVVSIRREHPNSPASVVMYRVGGREYPMRTVANCRVCSSLNRAEIEDSLLKEHVRNGHLPMDLTVRRGIMEERAQQLGKSIEDAESSIVDYIGFARVGLQRVLEQMAAGTLIPDVKDGIAFATLLMRAEELAGDGGNLDQQVVFRGFLSYMEAVAKVCTDGQVKEIGRLISSNPVIKGYLAKASAIDVEEASGG